MRRGGVALAVAFIDIAVYAILGVITFEDLGSDPVSTVMFGGAVASFSLMGALLIRRVPANPIGALLLATGTAQVAGIVILTYASRGESAAPPWPGSTLASLFGDVLYLAPFVIALIGIPLVFPDGRLPSPRFRWVIWITIAAMVSMLFIGLSSLIPGLAGADLLLSVLGALSLVGLVLGFGGAVVAVWVRFRRGDPVQREQLKWLMADAALAALVFPLAFLAGSSESLLALALWAIGFLAFLGLPVAIGIAVLRYRLYEIDIIIRRALVYVPLTAIIAGIYAASVALSQRLLTATGQNSDMAIVLTTLIVVVVFTPIKNAVQATVDRRFKEAPEAPTPPAAPTPPEMSAPQAAPIVSKELTELLRELGSLRDAGILTTDEFDAKKREILGRL